MRNLIDDDKATCLQRLQDVDTSELWDVFLEGQANLFFEAEFKLIENGVWWPWAERILEIGSGNGAYLSKLSQRFPEKFFLGIEKLPQSLELAKNRYAAANVSFQEGDAEIFNECLRDSADIVLFRLTLQHLQDPVNALQHARDYLYNDGYIVILDAYDAARKTSHPITVIDYALKAVADSQHEKRKGNRKASLELLRDIKNESSPLKDLYEVVFTNLDVDGSILHETIRFEGSDYRKKYFNHGLLFTTVLHRTHNIPVDLDKAYDELKSFSEDNKAWTCPGIHFLVLKKKS